MPYIADFNVTEILSALNEIIDKHPEGSRDRDVIELAQVALNFVRHIRKEDEFRGFYQDMFDPAFELKVSHEFATQGEADEWLASGKAQDAERVKVAGQGFMIVELSNPRRLVFMKAPLPGELKEDESKPDGE